MVVVIFCVALFVFNMYLLIRNYAIDTMGELKYMLLCAEERYEKCHLEEDEKVIKDLKMRIENHWGRRLIKPHHVSAFDGAILAKKVETLTNSYEENLSEPKKSLKS